MNIVLLLGIIFLSRKVSQVVTSEAVVERKQVIVIDPGHGGEDPGKVGVNGALEKDINLQVAQKLKNKLEAQGLEVVMTREADVAASKKLEDMKQRVALIEKTKPSLVVSIHQNSFTDASVYGAQVFYYAESEEGKSAAETVQEALLQVDPSNQRQMKGNNDYYMLKKTKAPTIIVECGFLSHEEEAKQLVVNEYQEELAEAICLGILKWLDK